MTIDSLISQLMKLCNEGHATHDSEVFLEISKSHPSKSIERILTVAQAKSVEKTLLTKTAVWIKGSIKNKK